MIDRIGGGLGRLFGDVESMSSMAVQAASLVLPLVLFREVLDRAGTTTLVDYEALLALFSFLALLVEWGTGFLVSSEKQIGSELRRLYVEVVRLRFKTWGVSCLLLAALALQDPSRAHVYFLAAVSLLGAVSTAEYAFLYWGQMHRYQATLLLRPLVPLGFLATGRSPLVGFAVGSLAIGAVQLLILTRRTVGEPWMGGARLGLSNRYRLIALNDIATAVFSQLDAYIVARALPPSQALIYLTVRKLVRATLSILNYPYRILFNRLIHQRDAAASGSWIAVYGLVAFSGFALGWPRLVSLMGVEVADAAAWVPVVTLLGLLLVVGVVKGLLVHAQLLRHGHYAAYLACTLLALTGATLLGLSTAPWTATIAAGVRLAPDVLFLALAIPWLLRFRKRPQSEEMQTVEPFPGGKSE